MIGIILESGIPLIAQLGLEHLPLHSLHLQLGSLRCHEGDGNKNLKKYKTLQVQHTSCTFSLLTLYDFDCLKLPNFKLLECKQYVYDKFFFPSLNLNIF